MIGRSVGHRPGFLVDMSPDFWWPSVRILVAAYRENLMAAGVSNRAAWGGVRFNLAELALITRLWLGNFLDT